MWVHETPDALACAWENWWMNSDFVSWLELIKRVSIDFCSVFENCFTHTHAQNKNWILSLSLKAHAHVISFSIVSFLVPWCSVSTLTSIFVFNWLIYRDKVPILKTTTYFVLHQSYQLHTLIRTYKLVSINSYVLAILAGRIIMDYKEDLSDIC